MNKYYGVRPLCGLQKKLFFVMLLLAAATCGWSCGGKLPPQIIFTINPDTGANSGQPFYVVVRTVNEKKFLVESYQNIAEMVFSDPPDPSILAWQVVLPGSSQEIKIEKPTKAPVAVYAMFTEPGDKWKVMLKMPVVSEYEILLKNNQLLYRKSGIWSMLSSFFFGGGET